MSLSCHYELVLSETNLIDGYVLIALSLSYVLSMYILFFFLCFFTIVVKFLYQHYTIAGPII